MSILGNYSMSARRAGFTLIELLVVIGLIAVLAAGVGLATRGQSPTATLRGAQGLLASTLAAARGQAALTQSNTEILVEANSPADDGFLRRIIVVVNGTTQVGGDIMLPEGAYVVPNALFTGVTAVEADGAGDWPNTQFSSFFGSRAPRTINGVNKQYLIATGALTPLGTVSGGAGGKIVIGPGRRTTGANLELSNPQAARGVLVSRYGVATMINEAESFQ